MVSVYIRLDHCHVSTVDGVYPLKVYSIVNIVV